MARRIPVETQFGSDSFLDIVANIVGILIILIVVAGVRVSRAPLLSIDAEQTGLVRSDESVERIITLWSPTADTDDEPLVADVFVEPPPVIVKVEEPVAPFVAPPEETFPAVPEPTITRELAQELNSLKKQIEDVQQQIKDAEDESRKLERSAEAERQSVTEQSQKLNELTAELKAQREQLELLTSENGRSQILVNQLHERLENIEAQTPETNTLAHRLNPVGRMVKGNEVHFRLANGKVSYVPVDQLVELVKKQVDRRKDILLRQPRFQASVGPVDGYMMEFLVQRESGGLFDNARYGAGVYRFGVTDWEIRPTSSVQEESLEQALDSKSQFRRAVLSHGTSATITFWVYPDSFDLHKELKEFLQTAGFWVASRPLPAGVPIAGSPNGSSSVAQ